MLIEVLEIGEKKADPGVDDFMTAGYGVISTEQLSFNEKKSNIHMIIFVKYLIISVIVLFLHRRDCE